MVFHSDVLNTAVICNNCVTLINVKYLWKEDYVIEFPKLHEFRSVHVQLFTLSCDVFTGDSPKGKNRQALTIGKLYLSIREVKGTFWAK